MTAPLRRAAPSALLTFLLLSACDALGGGCAGCGSDPIAELKAKDGPVQRDHASEQGQWESAEPGAEFELGDGIRTRAGSTARVELVDRSEVRLKPKTTIRFLTESPDGSKARLEVLTGQAVVEAAKGGLSLQTRIGLAQLEGGSRIQLSARDGQTRLQVEVGEAQLELDDGTTRQLKAGQGLDVAIGGAVLEELGMDAGAADGGGADAGVPDAGDAGPDADAAAGPAEVSARIERRPVRVRGPGDRGWDRVMPGEAGWTPGTTVRVARRGRVSLQRGEQSARIRGPAEYEIGQPGESLFDTERGRIRFEAEGPDVRFGVPGGAVIARGDQSKQTRGGARVSRAGTAVRVEDGRVDLKSRRGLEPLAAGETATLRADGVVEFAAGRGPKTADFFISAGESAIIRDPRPPTALGFRFGSKCESEGVVQLIRRGRSRGSSKGEGSANLLLPRGGHRYRVRCLDEEGSPKKVVARGRLRVVRDSGRARLPKSPPPTLVDTDGRRYTVLYQNLLPVISVRWPEAPDAKGYVLEAKSERGGDQTVRTSSPRHEFESGDLEEGRHQLTFRTEAGKSSPTTTLVIRFDNVAPKASVRQPKNRSFRPGETVTVKGVALPGWEVSVGGTELPLDVQQRFSGQVVVPKGQNGIAIRLASPGRGVHYYVRRSGKK